MVIADSTEPVGELSLAELEGQFRQAHRWLARTSEQHELPVTGSALAADDDATRPHPLSYIALTALVAAVDHFHAAATLVSVGRVIHSNALFTLLRAALENASTAVYLMGPGDAKTRILRALRVTWSDMVDQLGLAEKLGVEPNVSC
ncbi:hypothetical protein [Actinophytocola sp. KF-1]